jgi:hypothetical protein
LKELLDKKRLQGRIGVLGGVVRREKSCKGGIGVLRKKKKELHEGERSAIISKELHRRAGSLHRLHLDEGENVCLLQ